MMEKAYLTADKAKMAASAFNALEQTGQWEAICDKCGCRAGSATAGPLAVAWKQGFCYAIDAMEAGAIRAIILPSDPSAN